jgi:hypothetical protein
MTHRLPDKPNGAWPSVPHTMADSSLGSDKFLAPPKLSIGGGSNSAPVSPFKKSFPVSQEREFDESNARRRDPRDHEFTFPELDSPLRKSASFNSPTIIPLSPDPFGRFPSSPSPPSTSQPSTSLDVPPLPQPRAKLLTPELSSEQHPSPASLGRKESLTSLDTASRPPSSRFSLDSIDESAGAYNRTSTSLNPVKSIKSLWKRSRKVSISFVSGTSPAAQTGSGNSSPQLPPPLPSLSSAPSTSTPRSLTPAPSSASRESVASLALPPERHPPKAPYYDTPSFSTSQLQQSHNRPSINMMIFNQESPYPVHVLPPNSSARPRTASQAARIVSSASLAEVDGMPPPMTTATEREKAGPPKSILKSRRTESSTNSLPPDQLGTRKSLSRVDLAARAGALPGGGGRVTPPLSSSDSVRVSPSRRRSSRAAALPRPSPDDETSETTEPVPRLELDQRTR